MWLINHLIVKTCMCVGETEEEQSPPHHTRSRLQVSSDHGKSLQPAKGRALCIVLDCNFLQIIDAHYQQTMFLITEIQPNWLFEYKWCLLKINPKRDTYFMIGRDSNCRLQCYYPSQLGPSSSADRPYSNANKPMIHSSSINTDIPLFLLAGSDQSDSCEGRGRRGSS